MTEAFRAPSFFAGRTGIEVNHAESISGRRRGSST